MAYLGASDSYEACGYILLVFLGVVMESLWLRLSRDPSDPSDLCSTLGRSDSRKRHHSDPWGPNPREASSLLGTVSLDTEVLGISCLRF